jgi:hypothetical protein
MSSLTKSKETTKSSQSPWAPQAASLANAFAGANSALDATRGAQAPTDFVAQFGPEQLATFNRMLSSARGVDPTANFSAGSNMLNIGSAGAGGALSQLLGFNPNVNSMIGDANALGDNPHISGMVDAAMRDANRTAREVTLPGITQSASLSGNVNNSRRGLAEGVVQRGLAEKAGDISANLRGAAYDKGLDLSSSNMAQKLQALLGAGNLGGSLAQTGAGVQSSGIADLAALFGIETAGGAGLQAANQAQLDEGLAEFGSATSSPFAALKEYMSIIGSNNWGAEGTSEKTSTPSALSAIGGLLGAAGSFGTGFGFGKK